ncbi:energy transducer TonB [bacterium]|nr:energy transducer TonB [bacterium]MBP9809115.1 energy transducer TonB [bacterium]
MGKILLTLISTFLISASPAFADSLEVVVTNNLPTGPLSDSMARYNQYLSRLLSTRFTPPRGKDSRTIRVSFVLDRSLKMTDPQIEKSSNWSVADECAMKALKTASEGGYFRPLPKDAPSPIAFSVEFKYTVDN